MAIISQCTVHNYRVVALHQMRKAAYLKVRWLAAIKQPFAETHRLTLRPVPVLQAYEAYSEPGYN